MGIEHQVANHYSPGGLEDRILAALRSAGKDLERLRMEDFLGLDEFHIGGREATQALAEIMELRPGMHLLDVGCGIGGPARYMAQQGCGVTGIDLSDEFIAIGRKLTSMVNLDQNVTFARANALELPFDAGTFDGAYTIHAAMNIREKSIMFGEVARVLKHGGRFGIFDIMRGSDGPFNFPVPWAKTPDTSFVASASDYCGLLEAAGFRVIHQRERRQFAIDFMHRMRDKAASAQPPLLGVHLLMGEHAQLMLRNVNAAIIDGVLEPVELLAAKVS